MPFKSKSQARYFYANKKKLESEGVDVDEWAHKTDFKHLPEKKSEFLATEFFKTAWPDAEQRRINRSGGGAGKFLGAMATGGIPAMATVVPGLMNGADEVSGYSGSGPANNPDDVIKARRASGFGSALKGGLPIAGGAILGGLAGLGLSDGEPDVGTGGFIAGGLAGAYPAYRYSKSIGRRNAEEALGKNAGFLATEFFKTASASDSCGCRLELGAVSATEPLSGTPALDYFDKLSHKLGHVLDAAERKHIAPGSFALPGRRYPIEDESHARNALARASGKSVEGAVRAAVHAKYPGIGEK